MGPIGPKRSLSHQPAQGRPGSLVRAQQSCAGQHEEHIAYDGSIHKRLINAEHEHFDESALDTVDGYCARADDEKAQSVRCAGEGKGANASCRLARNSAQEGAERIIDNNSTALSVSDEDTSLWPYC